MKYQYFFAFISTPNNQKINKMKTLSCLLFLIFCCAIFLCCSQQNNSSDLGDSTISQNIDSRTVADCEDCPSNDCCCTLELISDNNCALLTCGIDELGFASCWDSPTTNCPAIHGYEQYLTFIANNTGGRYQRFCLRKGSSFEFGNPFVSGTFILSCQHDIINPQMITITVGASRRYVVDNSCYLTECN
jgi:hypothetical protein